MNAHPVHLFKTLQAQVSQKIQDPVQINKIWNFWINQWVELIDFDRESHLMHHDIYTSSIKKNLNASEKLERNDKVLNLFAALQNINKASFSNRDAIEVEKFAIALGHNKGLD